MVLYSLKESVLLIYRRKPVCSVATDTSMDQNKKLEHIIMGLLWTKVDINDL